MRNRVAVVVSSAFVALFLSSLMSCGSDSGNPTKPDPDPDPPLSHAWTPKVLGLPPADSAVLASAASQYRALRLAGSAASARASLVTALNASWPGVAVAGVTADGTTIQINFTDGVKAIIATDEVFQTGLGGQGPDLLNTGAGPVGPGTARESSNGCRPLSGPGSPAGCTDAITAPSHRVKITNAAPATSPTAPETSRRIGDRFEAMGWDSEDVVLVESTGRRDRDFTLEDIFDQTDAGIVVFVAEGVAVQTGPGTSIGGDDVSFAMQAFNGGTYSEYQGEVTEAQFAQYEQWQEEGKLIHGKCWATGLGEMVDQVYVREDLLASEIELAEATSVYFVSPNSGTNTNLEGIVATGGGASAIGWDGFVRREEASESVIKLNQYMTGEGGSPRTQEDALNQLETEGLTTLTGSGSSSNLIVKTASDAPSIFLPK